MGRLFSKYRLGLARAKSKFKVFFFLPKLLLVLNVTIVRSCYVFFCKKSVLEVVSLCIDYLKVIPQNMIALRMLMSIFLRGISSYIIQNGGGRSLFSRKRVRCPIIFPFV